MKRNEEKVVKFVQNGDLAITDNGEIWRVWKKIGGQAHKRVQLSKPIRAEYLTSNGYYAIHVYFDGTVMTCTAHRLVWYYFNGRIPDGLIVHHIDRDRTNNNPSNLACVDYKYHNSYHRKVIGSWLSTASKETIDKWHKKTVKSRKRNYKKRFTYTYWLVKKEKHSVEEAADILEVSTRTVQQHIHDYLRR